jgi:hypothetical protein
MMGNVGANGGEVGAGGAGGTGGNATATGGEAPTGGSTTGGNRGAGGATGGADSSVGGIGGRAPLGGEAGATAWPVCHGPGNAIYFRPSVYVTVPRLIQNDFTVEAWIATTSSRAGDYFYQGSPVAWADATGLAADFGISVLNGKLVMNVGSPDMAATSTSTVTTGQWVHIAATRQKATGTFQLYVNAVLEATAVGNTASLNAEPVLALGAVLRKAAFLDGRMDEVKLWETVRTQDEIQAGMHEPPGQNEPGLVGYYRFDEIVGTTVLDSSPARNHGTITGDNPLVVSDAPLCEASSGTGGASGIAGTSGTAGTSETAGTTVLGF